MSQKPKSLMRYMVDRDRGVTSVGITEVVVLCLNDSDGAAYAFVMSKVDAHQLGSALQLAALDAQEVHNKRFE